MRSALVCLHTAYAYLFPIVQLLQLIFRITFASIGYSRYTREKNRKKRFLSIAELRSKQKINSADLNICPKTSAKNPRNRLILAEHSNFSLDVVEMWFFILNTGWSSAGASSVQWLAGFLKVCIRLHLVQCARHWILASNGIRNITLERCAFIQS